MDSKLEELTEKIFREGVEKGEQEARGIIAAAEKRSAAIIADARHGAEEIIADAEKKASDLRENVDSDLRLAAAQFTASLKQQLLDLITARVVEKPLGEALSDTAAMTEFLKIILRAWSPHTGQAAGLDVLLPEAQRERLAAALEAALSRELAAGLTLRFSKNVRTGFQVQPRGASYKISLTDEDFKEYFKEYLRPRMRAFLFGE